MKTRKLVLIIADVLLLAICIVQLSLSARDTTKYFTFKDDPDFLEIVTPDETITLYKEEDKWFIGDKKYPANIGIVDGYIDAVKNIRALDKVGSLSSANNAERYEFTDSKKTTVTAKLGDKVLRTIDIGKTAVSSSQCYLTVDGGKDIYLVSGGINDTFYTSVSAARTTIVLDLTPEEIASVSITDYTDSENPDGKKWSVSRMGSGDDIVWNVSGSEIDIDEGKANSYLASFASLSTRDWYEDNAVLNGVKVVSAVINYHYKDIKVDFYEIPETEENDMKQFYGTCSETPYKFKINESVVKEYKKSLEELAK